MRYEVREVKFYFQSSDVRLAKQYAACLSLWPHYVSGVLS